jgi:hypothetical protein
MQHNTHWDSSQLRGRYDYTHGHIKLLLRSSLLKHSAYQVVPCLHPLGGTPRNYRYIFQKLSHPCSTCNEYFKTKVRYQQGSKESQI